MNPIRTVAAAIDGLMRWELGHSESKLQETFNKFDRDGSGFVDVCNRYLYKLFSFFFFRKGFVTI